jgi:hypothetical protein
VHPIFPVLVYPTSCKYYVNYVVLPEPVSPTITIILLSLINESNYVLNLKIGKASFTTCIADLGGY